MSEIRTPNADDTFIWPAAVWNAGWRALPREVQNFLGWLFFHEANAGGGIAGGFAVSEGAARRSDVTRGAALVYDSAAASPLSKWAWLYSEATLQATHDAHQGNPRIDLLTLTWATDTDTEQLLGRTGGAIPANTDTQRGCVLTLNITKGTAAATPAAPATPSGHLLLYQVYVPATSGALEYLDRRVMLPGPRNRDADDAIRVRSEFSDTGVTGDAIAKLFAVYANKYEHGGDDFVSEMRWDMVQDFPHFYRDRGGSGEQAGFYYPMLAYADRKWWETWAIVAPAAVDYDDPSDETDLPVSSGQIDPGVIGVKVVSANSNAAEIILYFPLSVQGRKLEVVGAHLDYKYEAAFTGADAAVAAYVSHEAAGGVSGGDIASLDIKAAGTGSRTDAAMTVTPTKIAPGDRLWLHVNVTRGGAGATNAGVLKLFAVRLQFKEGRG